MGENNLHLRRLNQLQQAKTCNEAASQLFPNIQNHAAFIELENYQLNALPYLQLLDLNDDFWAMTLASTVFVNQEGTFRQYNSSTGLYEIIQESTLIGQVINNLNFCAEHFPPRLKYDSFLELKNRQRLKSVIERAKDKLAVDESYFKPKSPYQINLANGILNLVTRKFTSFSPEHYIRDKLPVEYDPEAKPNMFLKSFLEHILSHADIDLLQQFLSQLLPGVNHTQKILILTGDAGWGKSTLMKILGTILSWERVGIIREQLFRDDMELGHYAGKHLLYAPDMNSQFLNRKESSLFKQLVGGDPLWAEIKNGRIIIEGNFPLILACNAMPQIKLDQDLDAWGRRLIVLQFKKPEHDRHFGKLADILIQQELSGILNWLLDGFTKLHKASLQLSMTQEQMTRANLVLLASESPQAFVRNVLVKKDDAMMGAVELYEYYLNWCRKHHLQPFSSGQFHQNVKMELETGMGLRYRHDLVAENGKAMRGWKGLALVEAAQTENWKIGSVKSEM